MARGVWAFLAFNVYSLLIISAFQANTSYLFDAELISEKRLAGEIFNPEAWGWKDHYVWRLFASVVGTALAAFLAGAIATKNGGKAALIANIPSILVWCVAFYLMAFSGGSWEGQTGFAVISLIAIPLTTWLAYVFGNVGAGTQATDFPQG